MGIRPGSSLRCIDRRGCGASRFMGAFDIYRLTSCIRALRATNTAPIGNCCAKRGSWWWIRALSQWSRRSPPSDPWEFNRELYKRRNEIERLFRRLKGFRRIFSSFKKLDIVFLGFLHFVTYHRSSTRSVNRP